MIDASEEVKEAVKPSKKKPGATKTRLERAISYWIQHDHELLSDNETFKRVAARFGVRWQDLREAIRMWQKMNHGK